MQCKDGSVGVPLAFVGHPARRMSVFCPVFEQATGNTQQATGNAGAVPVQAGFVGLWYTPDTDGGRPLAARREESPDSTGREVQPKDWIPRTIRRGKESATESIPPMAREGTGKGERVE